MKIVKMEKVIDGLIIFLLIIVIFLFLFAIINGPQIEHKYENKYEMPNGVICKRKIYGVAGPNFKECEDGRNYVNVEYYKEIKEDK